MKSIIIALWLVVATPALWAQTIHVQSGTSFSISDANMSVGTGFSTGRSATPGYFIGKGTAAFNNADATHNINGYVQHIATTANQAYSFPVGTGTGLRALSISGTIPATSNVAVAWIDGDPGTTPDPTSTNALHPVSSKAPDLAGVSVIGQWDWQDLSANNSNVTITAGLPDMSGIASSAANLRLVAWNGSSWIIIGTAGASGLTAGSTLSGTIPTGTVQALGIGSISEALSVTFGAIQARLVNNNLIVSWSTLTETNCSHYLIQASKDGNVFTTIDSVQSKAKDGNSDTLLSYDYSKALSALEIGSVGTGVIVLLLIGAIAFLGKLGLQSRQRKSTVFIQMILIVTLSITVFSCNKNKEELDNGAGTAVYIRIAQVDIDGSVHYSKVIKTTAE